MWNLYKTQPKRESGRLFLNSVGWANIFYGLSFGPGPIQELIHELIMDHFLLGWPTKILFHWWGRD